MLLPRAILGHVALVVNPSLPHNITDGLTTTESLGMIADKAVEYVR